MYFTKLLLLLFATAVLGKVVPAKSSYACQEPPPHNYTTNCFVDLTVAIDMSIAMKSDANIATLVDSILSTLMPSFNFKETYTAGLAYGALSIGASNYFNNYADICQYIHSAQEQAIQLGIGKANLSEVFETYQITLLNSGRNYKKVLVLLTSISDAKEIQAAKKYSDQLRASGVVIIVGALGNAPVTLLSQLGNYVIEASNFILPTPKITEDVCLFGGVTVLPAKTTAVHVTKTSPLPVTTNEETSPLPTTTKPAVPTTTTKLPTSKIPLPPSTTAKPPPPPTTTTKIPTSKLPPPPSTTAKPPPPTTPSTNLPGIGTHCSTNFKNAWLDIALIFDVSEAMSKPDLEKSLLETYGYISKFTLNQTGPHTTRVALISYASEPKIVLPLNGIQSNGNFMSSLQELKNRTTPLDSGVNVQKALQVAFDHLQSHSSYRPQVILLQAAAYQKGGFSGADHTADQIKENEITIFTVNFKASEGVLNDALIPLASPGYAYNATDYGIYNTLALSLTQVNCFCPDGTLQFQVFNATSKRHTNYADCVSGYAGETLPSIVSQYGCDNGVLAAVTSQEKLDFIVEKVIEHELFGKKQFTVGGHKVGNKWVWSGYNGTFEFGSFPPFTEVSPSDQFSFFDGRIGPDFTFKSTGDVARPYLCQSRACDADFICNQNVEKKKRFIKKH